MDGTAVPYIVGAIGVLGFLVWLWAVRAGADPLVSEPSGEIGTVEPGIFFAALGWILGVPFAVRAFAGPGAGQAQLILATGAAFTVVGALSLPVVLDAWPPSSHSIRRRVSCGLAAGVVTYGVATVIATGIASAYSLMGTRIPVQEVVRFAATAEGWDLVASLAGAVVLAPFAEEMFWRGLVLPWCAARIGPTRGNLVQALLFGAMHLPGQPVAMWPLAIPLAVVGGFCGITVLRTRSILAAVLVHMTFNALQFGFLRAGWTPIE